MYFRSYLLLTFLICLLEIIDLDDEQILLVYFTSQSYRASNVLKYPDVVTIKDGVVDSFLISFSNKIKSVKIQLIKL
jgi:hypothetical protein